MHYKIGYDGKEFLYRLCLRIWSQSIFSKVLWRDLLINNKLCSATLSLYLKILQFLEREPALSFLSRKKILPWVIFSLEFVVF